MCTDVMFLFSFSSLLNIVKYSLHLIVSKILKKKNNHAIINIAKNKTEQDDNLIWHIVSFQIIP